MNNNDFQSFIFNKQILTKKKVTTAQQHLTRSLPGAFRVVLTATPPAHSYLPKKYETKLPLLQFTFTRRTQLQKKKKTTTNQTKTNKIPTFNTGSQITNQINQDLQKQFRNYTERLRGWLNRHRSPYPHVPVRR